MINHKTVLQQYKNQGPIFPSTARLVSSLLYGARAILLLNLPAFENKIYTAYDRFHGNAPYGEIPTKKKNQSERSDLPQDYLAI